VPETGTAPPPESAVLGNEIRIAVGKAVERLPPRQRLIFALRQHQDMRFAEIAEILDITAGGARASYHRALLALQEWLRHLGPETPRSGGMVYVGSGRV
jgi:RNA polymerase sigma-70 factor (ECF subfamily)